MEVAENCACFATRKVARAITQSYDEALRPIGLRATQFTLLVGIAVAGRVTVSDLSEKLVMDRTTLARDVRPLETQAWVDITPGQDRRVRLLSLTEKGWRLLQKAIPLWAGIQKRLVTKIGNRRWDGLRKELGTMVSLTKKG